MESDSGPSGPTQEQPPPPDPTTKVHGPPNAPTGRSVGGQSEAWYSGPLPIEALAPRETMGAAVGRTAVKALIALIVISVGLFAIPFMFILLAAAIGGASGAAVDDAPTPRTVIAGEGETDVTLVAVPVTGVILGEDRNESGGLFSVLDVSYGYTIKEQLAELAEDESVDGVILEVDSPGGTIFGSQAIADGVSAYQEETGKPVVAFVGGISASGGVYAMAGADEIYADHGTLVGSIGVIFGPFTFYDGVVATDGGLLGGGVTTENGITVEFMTAGRSKDFGNPYRAMTDEEQTVLQEGLDDAYAEFVSRVSEGRDIPEADIEKDLGALIFGEQQALANGLIDGVADRDETYQLAAEKAGLTEGQTFRVERIEAAPPGLLGLFGAEVDERTGGSTEATQGQATVPNTTALCLGSGAVLAYHGDPTALCVPGR